MKFSEVSIEISANEQDDGSFRIQVPGQPPEILRFPLELSKPARDVFLDDYLRQLAVRMRTKARIEAVEVVLMPVEKKSTPAAKAAEPPRLAEAAFAWFAPKGTVDAQLGDLQELFAKNLETHGYRRARWLYWLQVGRAVAPALFRLLKRIGFIGLIIDFCRTKLGL